MDWIDRKRKKREIEAWPKYGPIDTLTDHRNFRKEALDELLDSLNYLQWGSVKGEYSEGFWKRLEIDIKDIINRLNWDGSLSK